VDPLTLDATIMRCVNARGLEHVLTDGYEYEVRRLPCGAVEVCADGFFVVCHGGRFEAVDADE
jgi:hypothetical protein